MSRSLQAKSIILPLNYLSIKAMKDGYNPHLLCSLFQNKRFYNKPASNTCLKCTKSRYLQSSCLPATSAVLLPYSKLPHRFQQKQQQEQKPSHDLLTGKLPLLHSATYLPIVEMQSFPNLFAHNESTAIFFLTSTNRFCNNKSELSLVDVAFDIKGKIPEDEADKLNKNDKEYKLKMLADDLSYELPYFLSSEKVWHDFDNYTKDVQLNFILHKKKKKGVLRVEDSLPTITSFRGMFKYRNFLRSFRWLCRKYLNASSVEVISMSTNVDQGTIEIRWRIVGFTPIDLLSTAVFRMDSGPRWTLVDFLSIFSTHLCLYLIM